MYHFFECVYQGFKKVTRKFDPNYATIGPRAYSGSE